ncbi:hypothetical protein FOL47_001444 [Perkinsus chesapeaki]|uniref:EF-hand domain-containing protein n=1 Tax=Perkinsus chesapeaki TaxID=330153 RepID=A0A7J6MIW9_PERCH|nr:hypothetical protein FOL47_001444 [Perkinsus chesapeaki]
MAVDLSMGGSVRHRLLIFENAVPFIHQNNVHAKAHQQPGDTESEEALKKAQSKIENLTEKLKETELERGKLEDALQGRELKMQHIRRRSTRLELQLKETEDMHKGHQEHATKSHEELRQLLEQERAAKEKIEKSKGDLIEELEKLRGRVSAQTQAIEEERTSRNELNESLHQALALTREKESELEELRKNFDALKIDSEDLKHRLGRTENALRRRDQELREIREAHEDASASKEELEETLKEKETNTKRLWGVFKEKWEHRERSIEELQQEKEAAIEEGLRAKEELKERFRAQEELLRDVTKKADTLEKDLRERTKSALSRTLKLSCMIQPVSPLKSDGGKLIGIAATSRLEKQLKDREERLIGMKEENTKRIEVAQKSVSEAREEKKKGEEAMRALQKELDKKESIIAAMKKEHTEEASRLRKELDTLLRDAETHRRTSVGLKEKESAYLQQFSALKEEFEEKLKSQAGKYQQELDRRKRQYLEEVKGCARDVLTCIIQAERDKKEEVKRTLQEYKKRLGSAEKHLKVLQHKNETLRERTKALEKGNSFNKIQYSAYVSDLEGGKRRLARLSKQEMPNKAEHRAKTPPARHVGADDQRIKALERMVEPIPDILRSIHHLSAKHEHSRIEREELEEENKDLKYVLEARYPLKDSPEIDKKAMRENSVVFSPVSSSAIRVHSPGSRASPPSSPGKSDSSAHPELDAFLIPGIQEDLYTNQQIAEAFKSIDSDGNGSLDESDIRQVLALSGESATDEEIKEMIRMVDHDGNGCVNYREFAELFLSPPLLFRNVELEERTKQKMSLWDYHTTYAYDPEYEAQFEKAIENKNTKIKEARFVGGLTRDSRREILTAFSETEAGSSIKPSQIKKIFHKFQEIDTDGSGMIDYEEFRKVLLKEDTPMLRRLFALFDSDGSGEIDVKEFIVGLSTYTDAPPKDKLRFAFMMFDEDNSGFIDKPELLKILRANSPGDVSEAWLERRAEVLYTEIKLTPGAKISLENFTKLAETNPQLLIPAFQELRDIDTTLDVSERKRSKRTSALA